MEQFKCSQCKNYFGREDVFIYSRNRTGVISYYHCRKCNSERVHRYQSTKKGKKKAKETFLRMTVKYPDKYKARQAVSYALKSGKIIKPNKCENCLEIKIVEGHHFDYGKPLDVIWMCRKCHSLSHRLLIK